jgi:hypothetical protein
VVLCISGEKKISEKIATIPRTEFEQVKGNRCLLSQLKLKGREQLRRPCSNVAVTNKATTVSEVEPSSEYNLS